MNNVKIFFTIIGLLILGVITTVILRAGEGSVPIAPGKYDAFAMCLKDKGATFYGAFWCPHCQAQKKLFGTSARLLPYVECSTADAQGQTQICIDKKIEGYPTWELADGTRLPVENEAGVTLATLAAKTSCELPQ
jgi:thiol-disulfide isomerase/thioredoxin